MPLRDSNCVVNRSVVLGCALGLIRKNEPSRCRKHQLSGSSSFYAVAKCLGAEYFQKQFELSDIVTLQTGHVVHRKFQFGFCGCTVFVLVPAGYCQCVTANDVAIER